MVLSLSNPVMQELVQDANLLRIKKLMLYACQQTWESDPARLEAMDLVKLVQDLLQMSTSLEQLSAHLIAIANTLSKPVEYTLIANLIISYLQRLYPTYNRFPVPTSSKDYLKTAQHLSQDPEALRIKKLIFCACKQTWQNNPAVLNQFPLEHLISELHQLTPTAASLDAILTSIVRSLNRSAEYAQIAERISAAFAPLYVNSPIQAELHSETVMFAAPLTTPVERTPQLPNLHSEVQSLFASQLAGVLEAQPAAVLQSQPAGGSSPQASCVKAEPEQRMQFRVRSPLPANLVPLRMELVKYTNPLRTKILLFSLLHYTLDHSRETWSLLKSHEMDELLRNLFRTYPLWDDVEAKLQRIARTLPEPTQYNQVAEALLRILRPYYSEVSTVAPAPAPAADSAEDHTSATELSKPEPTQINLTNGTVVHNETACLEVNVPPIKAARPAGTQASVTAIDCTAIDCTAIDCIESNRIESSRIESSRIEAMRVAALPGPEFRR